MRQGETWGDEFNLGTQYMTFLSFHVFFDDFHPVLEFMWVLMQNQAGSMAVRLPKLANPSQKAGMNGQRDCQSNDSQNDSKLRIFPQLPAIRTHRM